jgi:predicted nucleic acid-binding protein
MTELGHPAAPAAVRRWQEFPPSWIDIARPASTPDSRLLSLDAGEREAIQLYAERQTDILIIDEIDGRAEAELRGMRVTGTLGILIEAGIAGYIDPEAAYSRLIRETSFRISSKLEAAFFFSLGQRRQRPV